MSRVQLALNVSDLQESIDFYSKLFATEPHKRRPGYANFEIAQPPLKLVLMEVAEADRGTGPAGALNHLGVEVETKLAVQESIDRLNGQGLETKEELATTCCYAEQDKVWVADPAGAPWEIYTITDDLMAVTDQPINDGQCCGGVASVGEDSTPVEAKASACC